MVSTADWRNSREKRAKNTRDIHEVVHLPETKGGQRIGVKGDLSG